MVWAAVSASTGWALVVLTAATITLPYLVRGRHVATEGWTIPYLDRLQPHYLIGYAIGLLTLVHASAAMSSLAPAAFAGLYLAGIWARTIALLVLGGQIWLGRQLRALRGAIRLRLRRRHFLSMLAIVTLVVIHVALNGIRIQAIVGAS